MTDRNQQGDALVSPGAEGGESGAGSEEGGGGGGSGNAERARHDLSKNWFSAENTLRVYGEVRVEGVFFSMPPRREGAEGRLVLAFFASPFDSRRCPCRGARLGSWSIRRVLLCF